MFAGAAATDLGQTQKSGSPMKPAKRKYQAFIFDMDGVVVDSEPLHERAFLEVLGEIGYGRTHGIDFPAYFGKSDVIVWRDFIARHRPAQSLEDLLARKEKKFGAMLQQEEPIFGGLPELLAKLSLRGPLVLLPRRRQF
jgi:beta-phosphoglucomutase-like phosphatase (HAD superfamily)